MFRCPAPCMLLLALLVLLVLLLLLLLWLHVVSCELLCASLSLCVGCAGMLRVTALAPLAHWSGAGEGDVLDMCGVGVEAT